MITNITMFEAIQNFKICDPNILSDHCVLEFSILKNENIYTAQAGETGFSERLNKKYAWDDMKKDHYIFNLNKVEGDVLTLTQNLIQVQESDDIDKNINNFLKVMENVCDPIFAKNIKVPIERPENFNSTDRKNQPWFDEECQTLRNRFYRELNKYRGDKNDITETQMINVRSNFKNIIRKKRYAYEKSKTEKLIASKYENAKAYWRLLKQTANKNMKHSISSKKFADYFKAINDPEGRFYQVDDDILFYNERYVRGEYQIMFDELNTDILNDEILTAIKQLRNGASSGPDMLLNEFFKYGSASLINYLHALFNKLFHMGYFPEQWSEGFIVPIFKKGDINEVSNYRGITLLSTLGKLFTRILNNRLNKWAEMYNVYIEAQAGFRKHMGTVDNIFVLNGLITHCINENKYLYCCFVDFTKAFDYIDRDILW